MGRTGVVKKKSTFSTLIARGGHLSSIPGSHARTKMQVKRGEKILMEAWQSTHLGYILKKVDTRIFRKEIDIWYRTVE